MNEHYIIPVFVYGTMAFTSLLAIIFFMLIRQNLRRYRHINEKQEIEYQFRKEFLNAQIELQEHLLEEVSQEIHDNVAQVLSLVKVNLFAVNNIVTDDKARGVLNTSSELLDKAIDDLRNLSHRNNAELLRKIGLQEALKKELDYIGTGRINSELLVTGKHYSMPAEQELLIYRITQEAIHNCIKHANAAAICVALHYQPRLFTLTISDDGVGFDLLQSERKEGIGMLHMHHRARVLGATLEVTSQASKGTTISLIMPHNHE